jgi:hypothetical protein
MVSCRSCPLEIHPHSRLSARARDQPVTAPSAAVMHTCSGLGHDSPTRFPLSSPLRSLVPASPLTPPARFTYNGHVCGNRPSKTSPPPPASLTPPSPAPSAIAPSSNPKPSSASRKSPKKKAIPPPPSLAASSPAAPIPSASHQRLWAGLRSMTFHATPVRRTASSNGRLFAAFRARQSSSRSLRKHFVASFGIHDLSVRTCGLPPAQPALFAYQRAGSSAARPGPVKGERGEPEGTLDGWPRCPKSRVCAKRAGERPLRLLFS